MSFTLKSSSILSVFNAFEVCPTYNNFEHAITGQIFFQHNIVYIYSIYITNVKHTYGFLPLKIQYKPPERGKLQQICLAVGVSWIGVEE